MQSRFVRGGLAALIIAAAGIGAFVLFCPPDYRSRVEKATSITYHDRHLRAAPVAATADEVQAIREALLSEKPISHAKHDMPVQEYLQLTLPNEDETTVEIFVFFNAKDEPKIHYYLMDYWFQSTKLDAVIAGLRERAKAAARDDTSR